MDRGVWGVTVHKVTKSRTHIKTKAKLKKKIAYLFMIPLGLCCCARGFSSFAEQGLL